MAYLPSIFSDATLKLLFEYEETSGTAAADSSGLGHTGTASRSNILAQAGGYYGNKGTFVATSSDVITITDASDLKPTGNFSLGSWVKISAGGDANMIIQSRAQAASKDAGIALYKQDSDVAAFEIGKNTGNSIPGGDVGYVEGTTNIVDGAWHLIVGTWDGSNMRIYIDASLEGTTAWSNAPVYQATNYVRVGAFNDTGTDYTFWNGSLDNTFLFAKALSQAEITQLFTGVSASMSASASSSASQSPSASASASASRSLSPSASTSASVSPSPSPSSSVSASVSPSLSPSASASASESKSLSPSSSISPSGSVSSSPSSGFTLYSRGDNSSLPLHDDDLETLYTEQEVNYVSEEDEYRVSQFGELQYMIHQFKKFVGNNNSCQIILVAQSTLAPKDSPVYLQIYNRNTGIWETIDSNHHAKANKDFRFTANVASLSAYKDSSTVISCRYYQLSL